MKLSSANSSVWKSLKLLFGKELDEKAYFSSLPNDTILGMSNFKASADDKFGVAEIMGFVFEWVENIVGKGENAG